MNIKKYQRDWNTGKTILKKIILKVFDCCYFFYLILTHKTEAGQALLFCLKMKKLRHEKKRGEKSDLVKKSDFPNASSMEIYLRTDSQYLIHKRMWYKV